MLLPPVVRDVPLPPLELAPPVVVALPVVPDVPVPPDDSWPPVVTALPVEPPFPAEPEVPLDAVAPPELPATQRPDTQL